MQCFPVYCKPQQIIAKMAASKSIVESPQFEAFMKYGTYTVVKMLLMSPLTGIARGARGSFDYKEDYKGYSNLSRDEIKAKLDTKDGTIERIRRCHLNDVENIPPFILISFFYVLAANPTLESCHWHFRIFLAARIVHTLSHLLAIRAPTRSLAFLVGFLTTASMAWKTIRALKV